MKKNVIFAALVAGGLAVPAQAQDFSDLSFGLGLNIFGATLHGEYALQPNLSIRAMVMGGFSFDDEFEFEDTIVDGTADLGGFAVLADFYPLANPWRVSAGLFLSNNEVKGDFDDDGVTYQGEVAFENDIAPLLTTGFSVPFASGWSFSGDVGVIVSSLEVSSNSTDPDVIDSIAEANADLSDIPVFPYIGIAVSYAY